MNSYNPQRTHSGKFCFGKTPMQIFIDGVAVARKYEIQNTGDLQSDEHNSISSDCKDEKNYVTSQKSSDSFCSLM